MRLWVGILFYYFIILLFWGQLPGVSAMPWPARDGDGDCEDDDDDGEWWKSEIIIMLVGMKKKKGLKSQTQSASFGKWKINKLPNRWKPAVKISYYLIFTASPTKFFIIKFRRPKDKKIWKPSLQYFSIQFYLKFHPKNQTLKENGPSSRSQWKKEKTHRGFFFLISTYVKPFNNYIKQFQIY